MPNIAFHTCSVINSQMFLIGGLLSQNNINPNIYIFDIIMRNWEIAQIEGCSIDPRFSHTAEIINNQIYIFGGTNLIGSESKENYGFDTIWVLTNETQNTGNMKDGYKKLGVNENIGISEKEHMFAKFFEIVKENPRKSKIDIESARYISKFEQNFVKPISAPFEPKSVFCFVTKEKIDEK